MIKLTEILKEIGAATAKVYPAGLNDQMGDIYNPEDGAVLTYQFASDSGFLYDVNVTGWQTDSGEYFLEVAFLADMELEPTNAGLAEMNRVMATVMDIVSKIIAGDKAGVIDGLSYTPFGGGSDKKGFQRDRLYRAFIGQTPWGRGAEYETTGKMVIARFKK